MSLPLDKVRKVLKIAKEPISLETPIGEEEDSHLGDFIEDKGIVSPLEAVIKANLSEQTSRVLSTLTPREEKVLGCVSVSARRATTPLRKWDRISRLPGKGSARSRRKRSESCATRAGARS